VYKLEKKIFPPFIIVFALMRKPYLR
jgi:hypothetical protein